jgi:hypothetical protein
VQSEPIHKQQDTQALCYHIEIFKKIEVNANEMNILNEKKTAQR